MYTKKQVLFAVVLAASLTWALPAWCVDIPFTEHVISTTAGRAQSVFATDLDGDGDIDVLSAGFDGEIAWYENDGNLPPTFTERVISTTADSARSVFAIDVDGDGDIDVLSASCNDDKIAWYENDGESPPTFTERVITEDPDGPGGVNGFADCPYSVFATDVDGDGDIDVLSASRNDDTIAWYENDGGSPPSFTALVITEDPDGPGGVQGFADQTWSVFATDVDGDGDIDVLSASFDSREVAWYESDGGAPPTFTEHVITTQGFQVVSVFATDLDGDGDTDVLSGAYPCCDLTWYENDGGSPPTFTRRFISDTAGARSVFAMDVDGDGDIDVLAPSHGNDKVAWYENDGGSPPTFTERVITEDPDGSGGPLQGFANGASSAFAIDVDGDGDIDVLSASWNDDKIAWYENTAPPPVFCGNGIVEAGEQCDDEGESSTCDVDCTVAECGDGTLNVTAGEDCDDGLTNSDTEPDACRTTCVLPSCGDGVVDTGEECDDANSNSDDGCSSICAVEPGCVCSGEPSMCACRPSLADPPNDRFKNRYISLKPNNPGLQVKLKVTLSVSLPHPVSVGDSWWVQAPVIPVPGQFPKPLLAAGECVAILGPESSAALIDWDAAGCQTLHVTGCPIEPTSEYEVQAVAGANESDPLTIATVLRPSGGKWWGDIVGELIAPGVYTAPDGVTSFRDVQAALLTFQGGQVVPPGPNPPGNVAHLSWADVDAGDINSVVNINDVLFLIKAFQGDPYPFGPADADGNCP